MDENLGVAKEVETSPAHIEGPRLGQCTLNPEQHPAIVDVEQKENPVTNLYQQSCEKEKLVEILKEESRLLKARLKGFEALAYLYQQSKNECMTFKKLCTELSDEKELYRKKCLQSDNELHNMHSCLHSIETNISEATDPVGLFHEGNKLSSEAVGDKTADLHDESVAAVVPNKAFLLYVAEFCGEPEEPVELKSGEFKPAVSLDNRTIEDESQSSFSLLEIRSSLATSSGDLRNSDHEKSHDLEISKDISENSHQNHQERGSLLCKSHRAHQMESSATQTLDQTDTTESIQGQSSDHGKTHKIDRLTCSSSSSKLRKSSIVAVDLTTEIQILRQQVMTFKDDFERERLDREKVRSEYDLLKWHYDRVSTDFHHLKDQLRSTEIKLEESEREKAALRHNVAKTANELRKLKKGSLSAAPHTELRPQQVPSLAARKTWPCVYCTYLNPHPRQTCEMCGQSAAHRFPLQVK